METITHYIYQCYGLVCTQSSSDKSLRVKHLMVTPDITLRDLVPSTHGILQQIRRSCIQDGYLGRLAECEIEIPDPTRWGWKLGVNAPSYFVPLWQDRETYDINKVLKIWACSKGNCNHCSCKKEGLKCLTYCKCDKLKCMSYIE